MRSPLAVAIVVALLSIGHPSLAQVPDDTSHLGRGVIGLEAGYGQAPGALVFFFSSPTTSWLLGVDRVTVEPLVGSRIERQVSPELRLGLRKWPPSMSGPFKVFVGAGLSTADIDPSSNESGKEFGYGELGSVFFLGRHLGLVATGELLLAYGRHDESGSFEVDSSRDRFFVLGTRFRAGAAVYLF